MCVGNGNIPVAPHLRQHLLLLIFPILEYNLIWLWFLFGESLITKNIEHSFLWWWKIYISPKHGQLFLWLLFKKCRQCLWRHCATTFNLPYNPHYIMQGSERKTFTSLVSNSYGSYTDGGHMYIICLALDITNQRFKLVVWEKLWTTMCFF